MLTYAGVVILLFLAGLVPFSSVLFLLLALFALASCIQYNAIVRQEQQSGGAPGSPTYPFTGPERLHHAAMLSMMGTLGMNSPALHNLRLAMINRDFNESGGESWLARMHCIGWLTCLLTISQSKNYYTC